MPVLEQTPTIDVLLGAYRSGALRPRDVLAAVCDRVAACDDPAIWIAVSSRAYLMAQAERLEAALAQDAAAAWARYPLLGIPFAVKDNIDVAGFPTTAACPAFSYTPETSAVAVARLQAAGAVVVGKTNLDQFATGLVGTRTPYGTVRNPFNPAYIAGGSSSGSAAATTLGQVAFALGTDTAGSGRVPAGFCNLVGIKPTPGLVSNAGVFPACRSLDCVSIFAHTVGDAWQVLQCIASGDDAAIPAPPPRGVCVGEVVVGVPKLQEASFDALSWKAYLAAVESIAQQPGVRIENVDLDCFHEVATLLYDGPWVAERRAAVGDFFTTHRADMDPVVAEVIAQAERYSAADAFRAHYRLSELKKRCLAYFETLDLILLPTTPGIYRIDEIAQSPVAHNARLGRYTNFVNLLGLAALALPGPFRADGLPAGVTLLGQGGADHQLAELARRWEGALHARLGTGPDRPPRVPTMLPPLPFREPTVMLAVVGAHLSGLPLNGQLLERGARLVTTTRTAPYYRLYALAGTTPPKPGLCRVREAGHAIAVEVWELPERLFGSFVAAIPAPLGIGTLELEDGSTVKGFICEARVVPDAVDISSFGGWRAYLDSRTPPNPPHLS